MLFTHIITRVQDISRNHTTVILYNYSIKWVGEHVARFQFSTSFEVSTCEIVTIVIIISFAAEINKRKCL